MQYLHNNNPRFHFYKRKMISFLMSHFNKRSQKDLITVIWVLYHLHSANIINTIYKHKKSLTKDLIWTRGIKLIKEDNTNLPLNPQTKNITKIWINLIFTVKQYMNQHELSAQNSFPASNLKKGWRIYRRTSTHMTPFKKHCISIWSTYKLIYLADGRN